MTDPSEMLPDPASLLTRREVTLRGGVLFALGAFVVSLVYVIAKILLDVGHVSLPTLLFLSYITIPWSGLIGAVLAFRSCRYAVTRSVPDISPWILLVAVILLQWVIIVPLFFHTLRKRVLEKSERYAISPVVFFILAAPICVGAAAGSSADSIFFMLLALVPQWFCCDTLLINRLGAVAKARELAPLPSEHFQFSLGTLSLVIFCGAAWVTGLVTLVKNF